MATTFTLNGKPQTVDVSPDMPLLWVLRDTLNMTGTKFGCGMALCGACTVHINGEATRSCITPISSVAGKKITTIEGLSADGSHPVQQAWMEEDVPQCGYCQSGDHVRRRPALQKTQAHRRRYRRRHERQHLPLRHLPAHPQSHSSRRLHAGEGVTRHALSPQPLDSQARSRCPMATASVVNRRDFLKTSAAGGVALVI